MAEDTRKILIDVQVQSNIEEISKMTILLTKLRSENKELSKDYDKNSQSIELNKATIANLSKEIRQKQTVVQAEIKGLDQSSGAYAKLNLQYQISAQRAKDIAVAYGLESAESKKASKEAFDLSEKLKAIDKSVGQNVRSVGDYEIATKKLPGIFGDIQGKATSSYKEVASKLGEIKGVITSYATALKTKAIAEEEARIASINATIADQALATAMAEATTVSAVETTTEQASNVVKTESATISELQATAELARATATETATVATEASTVAMKIFKYALASTGIGLLVVALGSIVAYFASTNDGAKKFKQIFEGVSAVIQQGVKILGAWGKLLFDAVTLDFSSLKADFVNFTKEVINSGKNISETYKEGNKAMQARQLLTKQERDWSVTRIKMESDYNVLVQNASKRSRLSDEEKLKSAKKALAKKEEIYTYDLFYAKQNEKLTIEEENLKSKKDLQAIADAKKRTQTLIATKRSEVNTIENIMGKTNDRINKSNESTAEKQKRLTKERVDAENKAEKEYEEMIRRREAIYKLIPEIEKIEIQHTKDIYKKANDDLLKDTEIKENELLYLKTKLSIAEKEALSEIDTKYRRKYISALDEQFENEIIYSQNNKRKLLEIELILNEEKLASAKRTQALAIKDLKDGCNITVKELNALDKDVLAGEKAVANSKKSIQDLSLQTELNNARSNDQLIYETKLKYLKKELSDKKGNADEVARLNKEIADLEIAEQMRVIAKRKELANEIIGIANNIATVYKNKEDAQVTDTENANNAKKESLKSKLDDGIITQKKYDNEVKKLDAEADKQKAIIARKQAIRSRNLSLAQVIINTIESESKTFATLGYPAGIPAAILAGVVGAAETAAIMSTEIPKASRGMLINGKSHAQGGQLVEAEGGEVIINKRSSQAFRSQLSAINEWGGGVKFANGGVFNDGGYSVRNSIQASQGITKNEMIDIISNQRIYVAVEDIRKGDKKYSDIESGGKY